MKKIKLNFSTKTKDLIESGVIFFVIGIALIFLLIIAQPVHHFIMNYSNLTQGSVAEMMLAVGEIFTGIGVIILFFAIANEINYRIKNTNLGG